uniref:Uncharacterized protein n=1 Tax=Opuntia streptacantha TaxID=393608 RepID=A0A7C8YNR1_OPUST
MTSNSSCLHFLLVCTLHMIEQLKLHKSKQFYEKIREKKTYSPHKRKRAILKDNRFPPIGGARDSLLLSQFQRKWMRLNSSNVQQRNSCSQGNKIKIQKSIFNTRYFGTENFF